MKILILEWSSITAYKMKIPQHNFIYRHYKGGIYKVIANALDSEKLVPLVIYKSLDDGKVWARSLEDFTAILGDNSDGGTWFYRFDLLTEFGEIWERLEIALKVSNETFIQLIDIEPIDDRDILEIGYCACEKVVRLLRTFECARLCTVDVNPGKYTDNQTSPQEWAVLESNVFTGLISVRIMPLKEQQ
jgi:hypothetical protein